MQADSVTTSGPAAAVVLEVEHGAWFCSDPECVLHVRRGDAGVVGSGEWAVRPDGVMTSRSRIGDRMLCDVCARCRAGTVTRVRT